MLLSDYTAGTVTVSAGGTAVTGFGTGWQTAGFQEGDEFFAAGWHGIIQSVTSNTALTLYPIGIRGAALAGAGYRLRYQTDGSRLTAQARQLIEILGNSGNVDAFAGLVGAANLVPVFTGAGTMTVSGGTDFYARIGGVPNAQLPARLQQLGAGATDANAIADNGTFVVAADAANLPEAQAGIIEHLNSSSNYSIQRFYRRGSYVSYIRSKSFATWSAWRRSDPVERGSNANGSYVRLSDGTQFCFVSASVDTAQAGSTPFYRGTATVTLPAAFSTTAGAVASCSDAASAILWGSASLVSVSSLSMALYYTTAIAGRTAVAMAVGRWF